MASPQLEEGAVAVAKDLHLAIHRYDFTALEFRIVGAIIFLTYGNNKTKAEISIEDIRFTLGAAKKLRTDRISEAVTGLINKQILYEVPLVNGKRLLALQKDYEKWSDKMSPTLQEIYINNINTTTSIVADKLSVPELLLEYAQRQGHFKYGVSSWRIERKYAKRLYLEAIRLTGEPHAARLAIKDFIDENEWMRNNVRHQFTYMDSRFEQWYRQIPRKPREIREDEEALGKRYRYNVTKKNWEVAE